MSSEPAFGTGIILLLVGAFASGSFGLMLKFTRSWKWEHIWLIYCILSMLVIPWVMGFSTVPRLQRVLGLADRQDVSLVFLYGMGWGIGAVLYGLALKAVGLALSFAIVMGLTAAIGSLAPLLLLHPGEVATPRGQVIIGGVFLMIIGVVLSAWAGHLKERALKRKSDESDPRRERENSALGIVIAIFSGILSPMLNLSFAYGAPLAKLAAGHGTNPLFAANIIWVVALSGGFFVNAAYCAYLITRRRSWSLFSDQYFQYVLALLMGVLWSAGYIFYGIGGSKLGELAAVVGWPLMSSMSIMSANFWGAFSGEWTGTGRKPLSVMSVSVVVLCVAMVIVAWGNTLN